MDLEGQRATGTLDLRYEDVAQDGRVQLETIPVALGIIWRKIMVPDPIRDALRREAILPILTRFQIEGTPGPFGVEGKVDVEGGYTVSHTVDEDGNVARLLLDMDAELWANKGRTNLPPPPEQGTRASVGRVFAEHVFTRPFAPPGERKVLALPFDGAWRVPGARRAWKEPIATLTPPEGARALDADLVEDDAPSVMGLSHTDSNQHVNSLVYPRLFEEAALRRAARLGRPTAVLARRLDIAFRRPSFAGDRLRLALRAFEHEGHLLCVGAFYGDGERELQRARVYAQMVLE